MFEQETQPPNPEQSDYEQFFELITQHSRECAKSAGQASMPVCSFGSSTSGDYVTTFQQDPWGYRLNIVGNSARIPLELVGVTFDNMLVSGVEKDVVDKITDKGVHQLEIIIMKARLVVSGTFMGRDKTEERWDGEISSIHPDTKSLLPLITRTTHKYNKK